MAEVTETIGLEAILFQLQNPEKDVLRDYEEYIAHPHLRKHLFTFQYGGKRGESLYTHILNGIHLLYSLREWLGLEDRELRLLMVAFTFHDINKLTDEQASFNRLAVEERLAPFAEAHGIDAFFPGWRDYIDDILSLIRFHSGHYATAAETIIPRLGERYVLGQERVVALGRLMRAVDAVDLATTLDEVRHKDAFLSELNNYASASGLEQFSLVWHKLTEQRGLFTNLLHNAVASALADKHDLMPLLFYPDGTVYLARKHQQRVFDRDFIPAAARQAAQGVKRINSGLFRDFIGNSPHGIKIDRKCLDMGLPFEEIWGEVLVAVHKSKQDPVKVENQARTKSDDLIEKKAKSAEEADAMRSIVAAAGTRVTPDAVERLHAAEVLRTYYIFLNTHFQAEVADAWAHLYDLLGLPEERRAYYDCFDPRYGRAHVVISDVADAEDELVERILVDGADLLERRRGEREQSLPWLEFIEAYLDRYLQLHPLAQQPRGFDTELAAYIANEHKQCVFCSSGFATDKWMSNDVRGDITVQTFSNRLRGGRGEPKKFVCEACNLQFLLEKLNYPEVRGEKLLYVHILPYSFLTRPFVENLRLWFQEAYSLFEVKAAFVQSASLVRRLTDTSDHQAPTVAFATKAGKPHPYGLYLPRYSETVANVLTFPVNPPTDLNDTERFLYAFWLALGLQRVLGVKVLLSNQAIPPLEKQAFHDLFVDNIPLSVQGVLSRNDYALFPPEGDEAVGDLDGLWRTVENLFRLSDLTRQGKDKDAYGSLPQLIRAADSHPLKLFFEVDRLLEKRGKDEPALTNWRSQEAMGPLTLLTQHLGGNYMADLNDVLTRMAALAWENRLIGRTLNRSSLLYPFDEVLRKLGHAGRLGDMGVIKAAATSDIEDHLDRLASSQGYGMSRKRRDACAAFVDLFFDDVVGRAYRGSVHKVLSHEKLLRSAYLFHLRAQIPKKAENGAKTESSS